MDWGSRQLVYIIAGQYHVINLTLGSEFRTSRFDALVSRIAILIDFQPVAPIHPSAKRRMGRIYNRLGREMKKRARITIKSTRA